MSDTTNYLADLGATDFFTGLTDTGVSFTGSTTMQDVQAGSPLILDTSQSVVPDATVTDLLPQVPTTTNTFSDTEMAQMLSGTSDTAISPASMVAGTPLPQSAQPNAAAAAAISAMGKFGSAFASLFGNQPRVITPQASGLPTNVVGTPLANTSAINSGSMTLILVVVVVALAVLILRGD